MNVESLAKYKTIFHKLFNKSKSTIFFVKHPQLVIS